MNGGRKTVPDRLTDGQMIAWLPSISSRLMAHIAALDHVAAYSAMLAWSPMRSTDLATNISSMAWEIVRGSSSC